MKKAVVLSRLLFGMLLLTMLALHTAAPPASVSHAQGGADNDGDGFIDDDGSDLCVGTPGAFNGCPDDDGDGFLDGHDDACVGQFGTLDGCPDVDSDGDGTVDAYDECPGVVGLPERSGCPADAPAGPADSDGDGWTDDVDLCVSVAGALNGCPDDDGDGFLDGWNDQCPGQFGTVDGCAAADDNGLLDSDGDGVTDDADACPNEVGVPENNGCPVAPPENPDDQAVGNDADGDGWTDDEDACVFVWAGVGGTNGCPAGDSDGDGFTDDVDACPNEFGGPFAQPGCPNPNDFDTDGFTDDVDLCYSVPGPDQGCPDPADAPDADADGWVDSIDPCPTEFSPAFGCFSNQDYDNDGFVNYVDLCPLDGDWGQGIDDAGCPVGFADQDGDYIQDDYDACPDLYGFWDSNVAYGCPDDTDRDGLFDWFDACPLEHDNYQSLDGCPVSDKNAPVVRQPDPKPQAKKTPTDRPANQTTTLKPNGYLNSVVATTCPTNDKSFLAPRLTVGGLGKSANNVKRLNFRMEAGTYARIIGVIEPSDSFVVLNGPLCSTEDANRYRWWYVYFEGHGGWLAESNGSAYYVNPVKVPDNVSIQVTDLAQDQQSGWWTVDQSLGQLPTDAVMSLAVVSQGSTSWVEVYDGSGAVVASAPQIGQLRAPADDAYQTQGISDLEGKLVAVTMLPTADGSGSIPGQPAQAGTVAQGAQPFGVLQSTASGTCSGSDATTVSLNFTNQLTAPVELFWVGYDCTETSYGVLQPGETMPMGTYNTHVWIVRDTSGGFIGEYTVTPRFTEVHIQ